MLSIIWGSSFMLMKWGLFDANNNATLSPYQVAALRLFSAGIVMIPFLPKALKNIPRSLITTILLSGLIGSFIPAFLFCIAETKIDGSLAGSLNALTPLFVVLSGLIFWNIKSSNQKIIGVLIGLLGCFVLTYANHSKPFEYIAYSGFVIVATLFYGINVNLVQKKFVGVSAIDISALAFTGLVIPSLIVLAFSGYFSLPLTNNNFLISTGASSLLGILGTSISTVIFYVLVKKTGALFASLVTYGMPFIAIGWGLYYHEFITWLHIAALCIILVGVYLANTKKLKWIFLE